MSLLKSRFCSSAIMISFLAVALTVPSEVSSSPIETRSWAHVLGTSERIVTEPTGARCFETFVPARGLLLLEVSATGESLARPVIDLLGDADRVSLKRLERSATSGLFEVHEAGPKLFCVLSQNLERPLAGVKLTSAFVATPATKGGNPDEDEEDPDTQPQPQAPPPGSPMLFVASGLCGLESDDHGDVFYCASTLVPREEIHARISNARGDDEDVFSISVDELTTFHFETSGEVETFLRLYDRSGQRLQVEMVHDTDSVDVFETLSPGIYYLRVSARSGEEGNYQIRLTATDR